ncbi:MAG: 5'/3'-nucleotidase SurE [Christensenellaceae bacterium]|jgi:5'-nucleotidase|nr:5'/3'-nucleotidase SurE [Christensenellaceae bacterium]
MHILLVNDDGYFCDGITKLAKALINLDHTILVVAPDKCCSGMGHAETFRKPIHVKRVLDYPWDCYKISGTPCDCVLIGIDLMKEKRPDLIISGLNNGTNLGTEIIYSGTVNAALEGAIRGFKSIALSADIQSASDYDKIIETFILNFEMYLKMTDKALAISINYHSGDSKNTEHCIARTGSRQYDERYTISEDKDGYVFVLDGCPIKDFSQGTDTTLYDEGFTTITPLACEFTNLAYLRDLEEVLRGIK